MMGRLNEGRVVTVVPKVPRYTCAYCQAAAEVRWPDDDIYRCDDHAPPPDLPALEVAGPAPRPSIFDTLLSASAVLASLGAILSIAAVAVAWVVAVSLALVGLAAFVLTLVVESIVEARR